MLLAAVFALVLSLTASALAIVLLSAVKDSDAGPLLIANIIVCVALSTWLAFIALLLHLRNRKTARDIEATATRLRPLRTVEALRRQRRLSHPPSIPALDFSTSHNTLAPTASSFTIDSPANFSRPRSSSASLSGFEFLFPETFRSHSRFSKQDAHPTHIYHLENSRLNSPCTFRSSPDDEGDKIEITRAEAAEAQTASSVTVTRVRAGSIKTVAAAKALPAKPQIASECNQQQEQLQQQSLRMRERSESVRRIRAATTRRLEAQ